MVSEALDSTGVTAWAGQQSIAAAGESQTRLLLLVMLVCACSTALISVNGAVAALVPVVVVIAVKLRRSPSQLMMQVNFTGGCTAGMTPTELQQIIDAVLNKRAVALESFEELAQRFGVTSMAVTTFSGFSERTKSRSRIWMPSCARSRRGT